MEMNGSGGWVRPVRGPPLRPDLSALEPAQSLRLARAADCHQVVSANSVDARRRT